MSVFYQKGLHVGECVGQWLDSPQGKSPYFALKFNILARVEGEKEYPVESGERTVYLYLTDKALDMTTDVLTHLGYDKDTLRFLDPNREGFYNFAGKRCDLWCKHEEYNGEQKEKWSVSMPFADATPLDDKELRRLDALFGKALKTRRPFPTAPAEPEPVAAAPSSKPVKADRPPPPTDDDLPF
jgi:hypothetical protein